MEALKILVKNMETKERIRKLSIKRRSQLTLSERIIKSDKILKLLIETDNWKKAKCILAYADFKNEVMTDKIIFKAILEGKTVYLPKINGDEMVFYRIYSVEELVPGYFGIREPIGLTDEKINPCDMKEEILVIVPGTAFDKECNRIGYGKGFYDRYLKLYCLINTIGLAFERQVFESIPHNEEDIPISLLITEDRIFKSGK